MGGRIVGRLAGACAVLGLMGAAPAAADMPTAGQCAQGQAQPVTLGEHPGSVAICVSVQGHTVAYAGGNVTLPCGTIVAADQGTPATEDPNGCDKLLDLPTPDKLDFGVVLPKGYATSRKRFPVLYLLSFGYPNEWPSEDSKLQAIADRGVIIVLPNQGYGFYTDWHDGSHKFETLDTTRLIGYVDRTYRTIPDRQHRALAGASKAGYGAMLLAARHPDLYGAAASFSGIVDIAPAWFRLSFSAELSLAFGTYQKPMSPLDDPIWGNAATDAVWWHGRNPTDLVQSLRGIELYNAAGDGTTPPDELAAGPTAPLGSDEEAQVWVQNLAFNRALKKAGIPHTWVPHSGSHDAYYWVPELHDWAPMMMATFAHPAPRPATFAYRSADPSFRVWGWTFAADPKRAAEFLDVQGASSTGLTLTGSGTTTITTARAYRPRQRIILTTDAGGARTLRAGKDGRLSFTVDLGAPHTVQEYTAQGDLLARTAGYWTTRRITLRPAGRISPRR